MKIKQCSGCKKVLQADGNWCIENTDDGRPVRANIPGAEMTNCPICQRHLQHLEELNEVKV